MAYIGKSPVIGNFVKLDAITAVNGQAAYTMQNGGSNFTDYESVNQFLVSLNGTIQAPTDSFTVSGSTLTFASNLSTGDVIDFIMVFGNSLSAGTPTDATVSTAKIVDGAITSAKLASGVGGVAGITSSADATAITIDSSEQVGIGTTSPAFKLEVNAGSAGDIARFTDGVNANTVIKTSGSITTFGPDTSNSLAFQTNNTEQMRIDTSGNVIFQGTAAYELNALTVQVDGSLSPQLIFKTDYGATKGHQYFLNNTTTVGSITSNTSSTAFNTSSDYRLKENVSYDFDATSRLKQLKPARFNFIADADTTVDGFLAHEVQSVVPEAITGTKDAVKEDGTPDYQGIDQSKLVPLLVKTIQELEARITQLENA